MSPPLFCGIPADSAGCALGAGALGMRAFCGAGAAGALCGVVERVDALELFADLTVSGGVTRAVVL
jgi:hypothetical protein